MGLRVFYQRTRQMHASLSTRHSCTALAMLTRTRRMHGPASCTESTRGRRLRGECGFERRTHRSRMFSLRGHNPTSSAARLDSSYDFSRTSDFSFNKVSHPGFTGLASDDVRKLSNAWQRGKLVLNKGSAPYKSMLGEKSLTWQSSIFLRREVQTVLTTPSLLSASHFKR